MRPKPDAALGALELAQYFDGGTYGHAALLAADSAADIVEPGENACTPEAADVRYVLTDLGRRDVAMEALFGPWPTVAETQQSA
jgi:hypothetical protein